MQTSGSFASGKDVEFVVNTKLYVLLGEVERGRDDPPDLFDEVLNGVAIESTRRPLCFHTERHPWTVCLRSRRYALRLCAIPCKIGFLLFCIVGSFRSNVAETVSTRYSVAMECEDRCLKRSSSRRLTLTDPEVVIRDEMASLTRQAASLLELSLDWIFDDLRIRDVVGVWKKCLPVPTADGRWGGGALRNLFKLRNDGGDTPMRCQGSGHSALVEKRAWRRCSPTRHSEGGPWAFGQRRVHGIGPYDKDAAEFFCRGRWTVQVTRGIARDAGCYAGVKGSL